MSDYSYNNGSIDLTDPVTYAEEQGRQRGAAEPAQDHSIGELFASLTNDVSELMSTQMHLAVLEIKEEVRQTRRAATFFGAGALTGYLAVVMLAFACAWGLATVMPAGFAFLIVGALFAVAAGVCYLQGRKVIDETEALPPQTVQSLKEDVQWLKQQRT